VKRNIFYAAALFALTYAASFYFRIYVVDTPVGGAGGNAVTSALRQGVLWGQLNGAWGWLAWPPAWSRCLCVAGRWFLCGPCSQLWRSVITTATMVLLGWLWGCCAWFVRSCCFCVRAEKKIVPTSWSFPLSALDFPGVLLHSQCMVAVCYTAKGLTGDPLAQNLQFCRSCCLDVQCCSRFGGFAGDACFWP